MPGIIRTLGLCALLTDRGAAKVIKGQLDGIESWTYIDRFAFLAMPEKYTGSNAEELDKEDAYGLLEFEVRGTLAARARSRGPSPRRSRRS